MDSRVSKKLPWRRSAQPKLGSLFHELLERVSRGEEIVLTKDDQPIARVPERPPEKAVEHRRWPLGVKEESPEEIYNRF